MAELKYKRVLLKLSGEALAGEKQICIDPHTVSKICEMCIRDSRCTAPARLYTGNAGGSIRKRNRPLKRKEGRPPRRRNRAAKQGKSYVPLTGTPC